MILVEKNALVDFELYVQEGKYQEMKQKESFLKQAKTHLRKEFEILPGKRHVFESINMVAKFVAKEEKDTNHSGLIADTLDYVRLESLVPLLSLDQKAIVRDELEKEIEPYLLPTTYYVKPTLNKVGKLYVRKTEYLFGGQSSIELLAEVRAVSKELEKMKIEYEALKESLSSLSSLKEKKKLSTAIGSISYVANKPSWDMDQIAEKFGEDFFIRYGKMDLGLLDEWVVSGIIPKSIVTKNRTIVDIRLDFMVLPLDVESRIINIHNNIRTKLSLQRYA